MPAIPTADTIKRGAHADMFSPFRPWSDDERKIINDNDIVAVVSSVRTAKLRSSETFHDPSPSYSPHWLSTPSKRCGCRAKSAARCRSTA